MGKWDAPAVDDVSGGGSAEGEEQLERRRPDDDGQQQDEPDRGPVAHRPSDVPPPQAEPTAPAGSRPEASDAAPAPPYARHAPGTVRTPGSA